MVDWRDVERIASGLPRAQPGVAHDGAPTYDVGRHPFARLREVEGRAALQYWSLELDSEQALAARSETFFRVDTFRVKVSVWAWLDRLDVQQLTEILTESHRARRGVRGE